MQKSITMVAIKEKGELHAFGGEYVKSDRRIHFFQSIRPLYLDFDIDENDGWSLT